MLLLQKCMGIGNISSIIWSILPFMIFFQGHTCKGYRFSCTCLFYFSSQVSALTFLTIRQYLLKISHLYWFERPGWPKRKVVNNRFKKLLMKPSSNLFTRNQCFLLFPFPYVSAKLALVVTENLLYNLETESIALAVTDNLLYNLATISTLKMNALFQHPLWLTRLGFWRFLYHNWHKLRFYKKKSNIAKSFFDVCNTEMAQSQ